MVSDDSGSKWGKVTIIAVIVVFALALLIGLFVGAGSLKKFFMWLVGAIIVALILFGLLYIFYIIFIKKSYKDIPATYKKKLIATAKLMKNKMLGDLYLSGDLKHNRVKLGRFAYMRVTLPRQIVKKKEAVEKSKPINPMQRGQTPIPEVNTKQIEEVTEQVPVDCFVILKKSVMETLFGNPIFVLVKPEDHDYSSIFNDVTIRGFNLVPLDSQFYTIDRRNLDIDIIKGMATNYIREVVYEIFRDLDKLVKQAMNLDQQFQKDKQKGLEFEIPSLPSMGGGGGNERR